MIRNLGVTLGSLVITTAVIGNAYYQKKQFYPSVVYITKSNPSMAVIYVQAFILVIIFGQFMRKIFFGELRAAEFEHLIERSWYAVTETCLAFTVFRDDFSPKFVALFTLLLFLKSFHWLAEDRVDFMERSPVISLIFHIRILSLLAMLGVLDLHFVGHAYQSTLTKGASVQLVFGFEYAILLTITVNIAMKYLLHSIDLHSEAPWENKAVFLLYTELIMGFIKVVLYIMFVFIMVRIYTLPLFAFRPMYYTMRAFKRAFNDVILSRRAIRNMNTLYPDATQEELAAADNVCIICREDMRSGSKKLPCNHIFHTACLRSWFQRQQTCPTCRLNILRTPGGTNAPGGVNVPPAAQPNPPQPPHRDPDNRNQRQNQIPINFTFRWPPPPPQLQQPQQQQTQRPSHNPNQPSTSNGSGTSSGEGFQSADNSTGQQLPMFENIPFVFPPFPFFPFHIPPPMPPTTGLDEDELRRMEQQSREGVEARIRCLQNIQRMLDASVLMMHQYAAAAASCNMAEQFETNSSSSEPNAPSTSHEPEVNENLNLNSGVSFEQKAGSSSNSDQESVSSVPSAPSINESIESNSTKEQEEVRKRRLAKYSVQQNQL